MAPTQDDEQPDSGQLSESELLAGLSAAYNSEEQPLPGSLLARIAKSGDVVAGRYHLIEMIGEGGMSTVWYAEQNSPIKRKVAIKLIKPGMDSRTVIARFEAERQALAMMDHPNIAQVLDGGMTEWGYPFFVMELIRGTSITQFCDERRLSLKQRLELLIPVCRAIQHAHQKGIIHRDIKPSNVLVALFDDVPIPKVIDFGVAKAIGGALDEFSVHTSFGAVVGTPEYMSPEQAMLNNLDVDTRTDVYSLGVLAYELLAGSPPFSRQELLAQGGQEILQVIREVDPPKPSQKLSTSKTRATIAALRGMDLKSLSQSLDGDLDRILMKSLQKDRARRYDSADAMARDLTRYLNNEPVEAREPNSLYLLRKWAARYRWQAATIVSLFAAILLVAIVSGIGLIQSERMRARIEQAQFETAKLAAKEREAKVEAITQKNLAIQAEDLALASYRDSTNEAIEKLIGSKAALTSKEREYLDNALRRWLEFAQRSGDDARSEHIRAQALDRISMIQETLGEVTRAIDERRKAVAAWEKLVSLVPQQYEYQNELSHSRRNLGILLDTTGAITEAKQIFDKAWAEQKRLVEQCPDNAIFLQELAQQVERRADMLSQTGQGQEAIALMREALAMQRDVNRRLPDRLDYQYALGVCLYSLAQRMRAMGEDDRESVLKESHAIFKRLTELKPDEPLYQIALSQNELVLCDLLVEINRLDETEELIRSSIARLERAVRDYPSVFEYQQRLARAHTRLSFFLRQSRAKIDEALSEMELSNAIYQQIADRFPENKNRQSLANSRNSFGTMLANAGKYAEARQQFALSLETILALVAAEPQALAPISTAGWAYYQLADIATQNRDYEASLSFISKCIDIVRPAFDRQNRNVDLRELLIDAYRTRATVIERLGGLPVDEWQQVLTLLPQDNSNRTKYCRVRAYVESHQTDAALKMLDDLLPPSAFTEKSRRWSPVDLFNFACLFAQLSREPEVSQPELLDRAVQALRQAVKEGFSDSRFAAKHWALEPIHTRREFTELIEEMKRMKTDKNLGTGK